jgi:hypothetical protein
MDNQQKKYLRLGIIVAVMAVIVTITITFIVNSRTANMGKLTTIVVPDDALMTINGKNAAINKKIGVTPGEYTVKVKRSGFKDQEQKLSIKKTDNKEMRFFMEPSSPEGFNWLTNHPEQALKAESLTSKEFDEQSKRIVEKLPLIEELPFIDQFWRVDYGVSEKYPDDSEAVALYVKYWSEQGKQDALDWIKFKGYDPEKLEIIFTASPSSF